MKQMGFGLATAHSCASVGSETPDSSIKALVIGNSYDNAESDDGVLLHAEVDASDFAGKLTSLGHDVVLRQGVDGAGFLQAVNTFKAGLNRETDAVFFFAGHGATRKLSSGRTLGYIIPVDSDSEQFAADAVPMTEIQDIAESLVAKHILFVMDACYSGLGLTRGGAPPASKACPRECAGDTRRSKHSVPCCSRSSRAPTRPCAAQRCNW